MRQFDEAFTPAGEPREPYAAVIEALEGRDLTALRERVQSDAASRGIEFGHGRPISVDPVPRMIRFAEWESIEAGARQRARALNAFIADAYGEQRIFAAGLAPARLLDSPGYEPRMRGLLDPAVPAATVYGLDLVKDPTGAPLVLEDNLRMPSGSSYATAIREVVLPALDVGSEPRPLAGFVEALGEALRAAAPDGCEGEPQIAILSDGLEAGTWFEHRHLADALDVPVVTPDRLESSGGRLLARLEGRRVGIDVAYRRLDEERLSCDDGSLTPIGELLLPALEAGTLSCLNAFGTGVADDKLTHAYVERMIEFYLGEEPLLRSVPTIDLGDEEAGTGALERLDELVVKPRDGFGGRGVTIMPAAGAAVRHEAGSAVREQPDGYVAQEVVPLSSHPTVCAGRLRPRRVDLRPFVVSGVRGAAPIACGLTRYARGEDDLIVNSSQGGGCKDTWVVDG